ncbi:MAG: putative DNA binding domain-containing protein, partial [Thermoplasmata archaeon]|nr:putative DNA binding domain-containing protein [Thermoplasmata archaeon]
MDTQGFFDLIKEGENERIEFKSKVVKDIGEEICALGNAEGGHIFIGIADDGTFKGCDIKSAKERISQHLTSITPPLRVRYHEITVDDKAILVVEVLPSKRLCAIGGNVFIRVGTSKRPLSIQEIISMSAEYLLFEVDKTPTGEKDASQELVDHFISQSRIAIVNPEQYLRNMGAWTKEGELTISGLLFFKKEPQSYLPYTAVRLLYKDGSW